MERFLLVNPRSGDDRPSADDLVDAARAKDIATHVLRDGDDAAAIASSADATTFGMAGGDGSLAAVAEVALERGAPFVCVPFGTRNHFARDIGLDRDDPIAALDAYDGQERRIDVARAGDRLFLNNASLGLYASLVHRREHHRRSRQAFARVRSWLIVLTHRKPLGITIDGEPVETRLLLVANNAYALDLPSVGERERLDEGLLHAYVIEAVSRRALMGLLLRAAVGDVEEAEGLVEWAARHLRVDLPNHRIHAAIDGEPAVLDAPLELELDARALRVLVPPARAQDEVE
jgi:diacylglycerol kinase family enzyme